MEEEIITEIIKTLKNHRELQRIFGNFNVVLQVDRQIAHVEKVLEHYRTLTEKIKSA